MSPAQAKHRVEPGPNQIAHRLMSDIRNPHRGQLADSVQLGQAGAIAPIGLDPIPRLHRISKGATTMQSCPQPQAVQPIPQGPTFSHFGIRSSGDERLLRRSTFGLILSFDRGPALCLTNWSR